MKPIYALSIALALAGCEPMADIDGSLAANARYHADLRERIAAKGGCNADFLPVWMASGCHQKAFVDPMGSAGGSDGGGQ